LIKALISSKSLISSIRFMPPKKPVRIEILKKIEHIKTRGEISIFSQIFHISLLIIYTDFIQTFFRHH